MPRFLKALFGQTYSYDDLLKESQRLFNPPQVPSDVLELMALFNSNGKTFLSFCENSYRDFLRQIANKETRDDQRQALLAICIQERSWRSVYRAAKDAKHVSSWTHLTAGSDIFEKTPREYWQKVLLQRYLVAVLSDAWLLDIGHPLYKLDVVSQAGLDLYVEYDTEIKKLDVDMSEDMLSKLDSFEDDEGLALAKFKDEVVNPIIREQYEVLERLGKDVAANTLDPEVYQAEFKRIDEIKKHIARAITSLTSV
jgi:hypothetical protein